MPTPERPPLRVLEPRWIAGVTGVALLLVVGASLATRGRSAAAIDGDVIRSLTRQVAIRLAAADMRGLETLAEDAVNRPEIAWIVIQDEDGQAVTSHVRGGFDAVDVRTGIVDQAWDPADEAWHEIRIDGLACRQVSIPISGGPDDGRTRLGTLHLGFGPGEAGTRLHRLAQRAERRYATLVVGSDDGLTTSSPEARRNYLDGVVANRKFYDDEARTAWSMALDEDPHFAMAMVRLGRLDHDLGDDESAARWFRRAEAEIPRVTARESLEIRHLGATLEGRADDERAIAREMVRQFPHDAEVLVLSGDRHLREGRADSALADFRRAVALDPDRTEVWNLIGYAATELGAWEDAEEAFEKYTFVHQDEANPHDSLGEFYLRIGRYQKALVQLEGATRIKPDFPWAWYHLALANAEMGRWEASFYSIQRARESARHSPDARLWSRAELGLHLRAGRVMEAERLAVAHRAAFPCQAPDHALMARLALAAGDRKAAAEALTDLGAAIRGAAAERSADPTLVPAYPLLLETEGLMLAGGGRADEALAALDKALGLTRTWETRQRLEREIVEILVQAGRHAEAGRRLESVLAANPHDPTANWWMGRVLERDGRRVEARAAWDRARQVLDGADEGDPLMAAVLRAERSGTGG